jgi:hypothetical protein
MSDGLVTRAPAVEPGTPYRHDDHEHRGTSKQDLVIHAIRLGWYLAEVRGRSWYRGHRPGAQPLPAGTDHPLPLRPQRTTAESRQQAVDALTHLAARLDVTGPSTDEATGSDDEPFAPRLIRLLAAMDAEPGGGEKTWRPIAELMYAWDSAIQNQLTARADILACGYLLGRGLGECYWALAPDDAQVGPDGTTPNGGSWTFLFDAARRAELTRMVGRVGPYLDPLTPVAVSGSLEAWGQVAADPAWRSQDGAADALYEQLRRWYQILVLGQDPSTLVHPSALLHGKRTTLRLARAFWPQLLGGAASLAVVAVFLLLLTTDTGGAVTKTVLALVGAIGVSASTLAAKAKNATQSLLTRLRQSAHGDLVAMEVTSVPPHPDDTRSANPNQRVAAERAVEQAVTARTLTVPLTN